VFNHTKLDNIQYGIKPISADTTRHDVAGILNTLHTPGT